MHLDASIFSDKLDRFVILRELDLASVDWLTLHAMTMPPLVCLTLSLALRSLGRALVWLATVLACFGLV